MTPLLLLALLLPLAAGAQVQKCTIEGKTVYSDSQCGQYGVEVNATANSLDTSGLRDQAAKTEAQARAAASVPAPRTRKADPCTGIKPLNRVGTSAEIEAYRRCRTRQLQ